MSEKVYETEEMIQEAETLVDFILDKENQEMMKRIDIILKNRLTKVKTEANPNNYLRRKFSGKSLKSIVEPLKIGKDINE